MHQKLESCASFEVMFLKWRELLGAAWAMHSSRSLHFSAEIFQGVWQGLYTACVGGSGKRRTKVSFCVFYPVVLITIISFFLSPSSFYLTRLGVWVIIHFITHNETPQSVGLLWTRDRPVAEANKQHSQQTSMPPAGFEPAIPAGDRLQTLALDRSASGIGWLQ